MYNIKKYVYINTFTVSIYFTGAYYINIFN